MSSSRQGVQPVHGHLDRLLYLPLGQTHLGQGPDLTKGCGPSCGSSLSKKAASAMKACMSPLFKATSPGPTL